MVGLSRPPFTFRRLCQRVGKQGDHFRPTHAEPEPAHGTLDNAGCTHPADGDLVNPSWPDEPANLSASATQRCDEQLPKTPELTSGPVV